MNWEDLIPTVDNTVDAMWGERIILQPWKKDNEFTHGSIDASRHAVECYGCYMLTKTDVGGLGGSSGGGFLSRVAEQMVMVSLQQKFVDLGKIVKGDLIQMVDRELTLEISYVEPSDTKRPMLHLLRMNDTLDLTNAFRAAKPHRFALRKPSFKLPKGFKL